MNKYLPNRNIDITKKTIREIYDLMRYQINSTSRSRTSNISTSAMGKYQFLLKTLKEMVHLSKLSLDTYFNKATQDYLILLRLNKTRHYDEWVAGTLSDINFIHELSKEFASIEDPWKKNGKGHYKGQKAANKAKNFLVIFAKMRKLMGKTDKPSSSKHREASSKRRRGHHKAISNAKATSIMHETLGVAKNPTKLTKGHVEREKISKAMLERQIDELPIDKLNVVNDVIQRNEVANSNKHMKDYGTVLNNIYGVNKEMLRTLTIIANKEYVINTTNTQIVNNEKVSETKSITTEPKVHRQARAFRVDNSHL